MMFYWIIPLILLILLLVIIFSLMSRVFNTVPVAYEGSPADLGIPFESVEFESSKKLKLKGWWIKVKENEPQPILVLVHGWRRNAERMLPYVEALHPHFNLLVFDSRNHGKSDSDNFTSMPKFTEDILASLDYLDERTELNNLTRYVLGLSMGGGGAIYAAAKDKRISGIITVGAFANPADLMKREYKKRHIPYFPMVYFLFKYFEHRIGEKFNDFAPENQIDKSSATFLILHGTEDKTTPFSHGERLHRAAIPENSLLWAVEGAGHSNCHEFPGFWEKIIGYVKNKKTPGIYPGSKAYFK